MGFFDGWDSASVISRKSHSSRHHSSSQHNKRRSKGSLRPKSRSRSGTRSPAARTFFAAAEAEEEEEPSKPRYSRHNSSRTSFFGLPSASSRSFFGTGMCSHLLMITHTHTHTKPAEREQARPSHKGPKVNALGKPKTNHSTHPKQQTSTEPPPLHTAAPRGPASSPAPTGTSGVSCGTWPTTRAGTPSRSSRSSSCRSSPAAP